MRNRNVKRPMLFSFNSADEFLCKTVFCLVCEWIFNIPFTAMIFYHDHHFLPNLRLLHICDPWQSTRVWSWPATKAHPCRSDPSTKAPFWRGPVFKSEGIHWGRRDPGWPSEGARGKQGFNLGLQRRRRASSCDTIKSTRYEIDFMYWPSSVSKYFVSVSKYLISAGAIQ